MFVCDTNNLSLVCEAVKRKVGVGRPPTEGGAV